METAEGEAGSAGTPRPMRAAAGGGPAEDGEVAGVAVEEGRPRPDSARGAGFRVGFEEDGSACPGRPGEELPLGGLRERPEGDQDLPAGADSGKYGFERTRRRHQVRGGELPPILEDHSSHGQA
jgi:hypothetical protein